MLSGRGAAALVVGVSVATYAVDIRVTRTLTGVRLRVAVTDAVTRAPVRRLAVIDDKPLHLFVVGGAGLRVYRHELPELQHDGSFSADLDLPEAGLYMAFAEFVPERGWPQLVQQAFTTGSGFAARTGDPADEPPVSNGIRGAVDASELKSGGVSRLAFDLADDASGAPVRDLEPYLGASAHLFVVSSDLTEGQHLRAQDDQRGPRIVFAPLLPRKGRYKMWLQVQRAGNPSTIPFAIDVP
jgi:hypothetical protein